MGLFDFFNSSKKTNTNIKTDSTKILDKNYKKVETQKTEIKKEEPKVEEPKQTIIFDRKGIKAIPKYYFDLGIVSYDENLDMTALQKFCDDNIEGVSKTAKCMCAYNGEAIILTCEQRVICCNVAIVDGQPLFEQNASISYIKNQFKTEFEKYENQLNKKLRKFNAAIINKAKFIEDKTNIELSIDNQDYVITYNEL